MSKPIKNFFSQLKTGVKANGEYKRKKLKKLISSENRKPINKKAAKRIVMAVVFTVLACICILLGIKAVDYTFEPETDVTGATGFIAHEGETEDKEEQHNAAMLTDLQNVGELSSLLKLWATNDTAEKIHDDNVLNFLFIGIDNASLSGYGNSDAIILVSVNTETSVINMVSFYRDSYTYINSAYGDQYAKINAAYANGGADLLVKTVEDDYKIKIDYYAAVNFATFVEVVDLLGGVTLNVPQYVANYIYSAWNIECPAGDNVLLNGEQALRFVRARHCDADSDVSRTRRQREFITSLVHAASGIKLTQLDDLLKTLCKYVKTDCSNAKIISFATKALREKWYDYTINSISVPDENFRTDYRGFGWVWIVDYPGAAQALQQLIYGYSTFTISEGTRTAVELMGGISHSGQTESQQSTEQHENQTTSGSGNEAEEQETTSARENPNTQTEKTTAEATARNEETTVPATKQITEKETTVPVTRRRADEVTTGNGDPYPNINEVGDTYSEIRAGLLYDLGGWLVTIDELEEGEKYFSYDAQGYRSIQEK